MNENPTQPVPDDILLQLLDCLIAALECRHCHGSGSIDIIGQGSTACPFCSPVQYALTAP